MRKSIRPRLPEPSPYELAALAEIEKFKNPKPSSFSNALSKVTRPIGKALDALSEQEFAQILSKALVGILDVINEGAAWSVRPAAILAEFQGDEHAVSSLEDIRRLDLEAIERTLGYLAAKYKAVAAAEGAATGAAGLPGLAVDIPALFSIALRAVSEYATYYGFDIRLQEERKFAMQVLFAATSVDVAARKMAMAQLTKASLLVAKGATWKEIEKIVLAQGIRYVGKAIGVRITKRKLSQILPVVGAVTGGAFNALYLREVTEMASMMYRERFLLQKYGADVMGEEKVQEILEAETVLVEADS